MLVWSADLKYDWKWLLSDPIVDVSETSSNCRYHVGQVVKVFEKIWCKSTRDNPATAKNRRLILLSLELLLWKSSWAVESFFFLWVSSFFESLWRTVRQSSSRKKEEESAAVSTQSKIVSLHDEAVYEWHFKIWGSLSKRAVQQKQEDTRVSTHVFAFFSLFNMQGSDLRIRSSTTFLVRKPTSLIFFLHLSRTKPHHAFCECVCMLLCARGNEEEFLERKLAGSRDTVLLEKDNVYTSCSHYLQGCLLSR